MGRRKMAFKSIAIASGILLHVAFGGAVYLRKLAYFDRRLRIAGGMLLFLIAVDVFFEKRCERREERAEQVAAEQAKHPGARDDISVFSLAIPLISGPRAIASIMLFFAEHEEHRQPQIILLGVGALHTVPDCVPGR